jgi:hypothetical protein
MDFCLQDGEKWIVASGSGRVLVELKASGDPVWEVQMSRTKFFTDYQDALNFITKHKLHGSPAQVKDLFIPVYLVLRIKEQVRRIHCELTWIHQNSQRMSSYFQTREAAQKELDKLKAEIVMEHHEVIMYSRSVVLPEFK